MNLLFIVEGETERLVYPCWLRFLSPHLARVDFPADAVENNYCLQAGDGYPQIFKYVGAAIDDLNDLGNFDFLIICIDTEEMTREDRMLEVSMEIKKHKPRGYEVVVILQHSCIETWFLGNRKAVSKNPKGELFQTILAILQCCRVGS
jgi:hypothetical protein